jgi:hypothetical protein
VAWLAPQYATVRAGLNAERVELRDKFVGNFPHARTPDIIANLMLGLRYLLKFALHTGAIHQHEHDALEKRGDAAFQAVAANQGEYQRAADPIARFPEMLAAIISSGRGHVAAPEGGRPHAPLKPEQWGWDASRSDHERITPDFRARGQKIGWARDTELYLDPDLTYAALAELARDQGLTYPVTQQTFCRRLKEAGLLSRTEGDRTTYPVALEGPRRRVLVLSTSVLQEPGQTGQTGQDP